ncbi:MAG: branched-chain amino acid ABC transporter permease [Burkholderiaceae bacterium]|jgi:branched-chain amino acid transport system permease protein|nr:branched-chain amino acid ABC transporter permease [Burkholderiales bacterium]MBP7566333.1 branched-chain amino acid ABC transporter permease [Burkholderiaceae bacterium]
MQIDPTYLLQLALNGLMLGLIYALIAVGLSLIFGVLDIINFAHGEVLMVGAFVMSFALGAFDGRYIPATLVTLAASAVLGVLLYDGFIVRLREKDFESSILITTGISMVLLYGMQYLFSSTPRMVTTELGYQGLQIGSIRITWTRVAACGIALIAFVSLWLVLYRTQLGRAMRAVAINREAALMVGIKPRTVARNAVVIATVLAGLAGAALAPVHLVQPIMGQFLIFKAFALVVIGGLGSVGGAIVAGLLIGIVESWVGGFFNIIWQETAGFIIMIVILMVRPHGLFGQRNMRVG